MRWFGHLARMLPGQLLLVSGTDNRRARWETLDPLEIIHLTIHLGTSGDPSRGAEICGQG